MITTQKTLRAAFWCDHPQFTRKGRQTQNQYKTDIRVTWCDYVDHMNRIGLISDKLANRATL